jgi:hypothetical protein
MNALPVLTLGRKPPLALEAYRAKIRLAKESAPITSRKDHPGRLEVVIPKQDTSGRSRRRKRASGAGRRRALWRGVAAL